MSRMNMRRVGREPDDEGDKSEEGDTEIRKSWYEWLDKEGNGCRGWHNLGDGPKEKNYSHWVIAWKIGRQPHNNITLQAVEFPETADMAEWDAMASEMRSEAKRVWDTRKETADDSD